MEPALRTPLTRTIVVGSDPTRTIDTLLAAMEYLNAGEATNAPEVETVLDLIMVAASQGDQASLERATAGIEQMVHRFNQP